MNRRQFFSALGTSAGVLLATRAARVVVTPAPLPRLPPEPVTPATNPTPAPKPGHVVELRLRHGNPDGDQHELAYALGKVPDGDPERPTLIKIPPVSFRNTHRLRAIDRHNLILDFQGATIYNTASAETIGQVHGHALSIVRGSNLHVRNVHIRGGHPFAGEKRGLGRLGNHPGFSEAIGGVAFYGVQGAVLENFTVSTVWSDGVMTGMDSYTEEPGDPPPQNLFTRRLVVRRGKIQTTGRHNISPNQGEDLLFEDLECSDAWYWGMDAELDNVGQTLRRITFRDVSFAGFFMGGFAVPVFAADGSTGDFLLERVRLLTPPDNVCNAGILFGAYPETNPAVASRVRLQDCVVTHYADSPAVILDHINAGRVHGLTVHQLPAAGCGAVDVVRVTNPSGAGVQVGRINGGAGK